MSTRDHSAAAPVSIRPRHVEHREAFWDFVLEQGEDWHREHLSRLFGTWMDANDRHFAAELVPPIILLSETVIPAAFGDCAPISGYGCRSQIRLRPSLLRGTHPRIDIGAPVEGRHLFVEDVLLHEMVHQWQQEVSGDLDEGYHGHGPAFRDKANEFGRRLGLTPVRTSKRRGRDKDLPSCSQWPHNVRPEDYYLGAYQDPERILVSSSVDERMHRLLQKQVVRASPPGSTGSISRRSSRRSSPWSTWSRLPSTCAT